MFFEGQTPTLRRRSVRPVEATLRGAAQAKYQSDRSRPLAARRRPVMAARKSTIRAFISWCCCPCSHDRTGAFVLGHFGRPEDGERS